jgi:hypothetical protein
MTQDIQDINNYLNQNTFNSRSQYILWKPVIINQNTKSDPKSDIVEEAKYAYQPYYFDRFDDMIRAKIVHDDGNTYTYTPKSFITEEVKYKIIKNEGSATNPTINIPNLSTGVTAHIANM